MIDSANSRSKNYLFVTFRSSGMETHLRISVFLDLFGLGLFLNSTYFLLFVSAMRFIDRFRNWLSDPITDFFFTSFTTLRLHCSGSCGTAFFLMLFTGHFCKMVYVKKFVHSRLKYLGGVPVLWCKWPLASSLLQAIKTCRQACPPGYLMHFS